MGGRVGSITTEIIADGLVFNMDAANKASYIPNATTSFDTINNLSGSFENGVTFVSSSFSTKSWLFDESDDKIKVEVNSDYKVGDYTIQFWIKDNSSDGNNFVMGGVNGFGVDINYGSLRLPRAGWPDNNISAGNSDKGYWRNFAFTGNRTTGVLKSYKTGSFANTVTNAAWNDNTRYIQYFGANYLGSNYYGGLIANFVMYNRVLSDNEILHNYNALKGRFGL